MPPVSRAVRAAAGAVLLAPSLLGGQQAASPGLGAAAQARLLTRRAAAHVDAKGRESAGIREVDFDTAGTVVIHVPAGYSADRPAPLVVLLHGAGGNPRRVLGPVMAFADSAGVITIAPKSYGATWDVIRGRYGPDVAFIDRALAYALARFAVDTTRLAIGGFSDGASYALSLGVTNGDLFTHVIAFSPGFMVPVGRRGEPRLFVSHGTRDQILSIDACSRRIVRQVRSAGYDVRYREFDGGHSVPAAIAREAMTWLAGEWTGRR